MREDRRTDLAEGPDRRGGWSETATRRRIVLLMLILGQTWLACDFMVRGVLPYHAQQPLELAILCVFAILFAWISAGFWTALAGFATLSTGRDRFAITRTIRPEARASDIPAVARTAVVMPICNEDVARVFAGLRATYESLAATGAGDRFDFFILSDSTDPDTRVDEHAAWFELCRAVNGFGRVFYRWRKHRITFFAGQPYLAHMAIGDHWMVHYLNAGMAENAAKRAEEATAMAHFDEDFAVRHAAAFAGLYERLGLDYFAIDCAELPDGQLLLFEADVSMIVHALDPVDVYPYKRLQMAKLFGAFDAMLRARAGV